MLTAALLATLAAGLFTGAAVYITFVEHPARVSCGSVLAVTEFGPSYKRATVMQASLALIGASAGIARWAAGGGLGWLAEPRGVRLVPYPAGERWPVTPGTAEVVRPQDLYARSLSPPAPISRAHEAQQKNLPSASTPCPSTTQPQCSQRGASL